MAHTAEAQKALSELCVELLRDCRVRLTGPESLQDEELVHDLRVATKRLRAAWHLAKESTGSKLAKKRRKALRTLSAHLSSRRDVAVLEDLAEILAVAATSPTDRALLEKLKEAIGAEPQAERCPDGLLEEVRASVDDEIAAWEAIDWGRPEQARKAIRRTLRRTNSRAKKRTREALKDNAAEVWHDWRKAIKRLRYQREFVIEATGRQPGKADDRISRLGSALGERNDLANLLSYGERSVKSGVLRKKDLKQLRRIIGRVERDLLRNCRRLGRRFLKKKN